MRLIPSLTVPIKAEIKPYFTSKEAWVLPKEESALAPEGVWTNADLDPVPPSGQTWTTMDFFMYWISDLVNAGSFAAVASYASLGLTWWEGVLANMLGGFLVAITICLNGIVGATLHTPFAVTARAAYGYYGSKFPIISRMIIACFWMSINSYQAGIYLRLMISSIWPSFNNLPNTIPVSQGTTSIDFLCFFLYTLLQFPFILIHPSKLRPLFIFKSVTIPLTAVAMFIWACAVAGSDLSDLMEQAIVRAEPGRNRFIAFMGATTASMGVWSTMANNIGDFSRYCKKPSAAYIQLLTIPFLQSALAILGAVTAFAASGMYGELLWQPYDIIEKWQVSSGGRAAAFFASLAWAIGQLTTNITANSISASTDIVSLCPKYFNIKRGQVIVATVGVFGFAPWKVLMAAGNFITFMASYSIVLAPMAAILAADYFLIKRRNMDIPAMYDPNGRYRYAKGWNWRAFAALLIAIGPNLPGMMNAIQPKIEIGNIRHIYLVSNIWGATTGVAVLYILSTLFPNHEAIIEAPIMDLGDITEPEMLYRSEDNGDEKAEEAEKSVGVTVRAVQAEGHI